MSGNLLHSNLWDFTKLGSKSTRCLKTKLQDGRPQSETALKTGQEGLVGSETPARPRLTLRPGILPHQTRECPLHLPQQRHVAPRPWRAPSGVLTAGARLRSAWAKKTEPGGQLCVCSHSQMGTLGGIQLDDSGPTGHPWKCLQFLFPSTKVTLANYDTILMISEQLLGTSFQKWIHSKDSKF